MSGTPIAMTSETIFAPLKPIGDRIYLYTSPEKDAAGSNAPSLVVLCTWVGGATPRRINKYISKYRDLYPHTSIILITTDLPNTAFRPFSWIRASLKPARIAIRQIIQGIGNETPDLNGRGGILLHLFSHGGGNTALQLALSMKEDEDQGVSFFTNLKGLILDCCPGDDGFERAYAAASMSLPEAPLSRYLGETLLYPTVAVINTLQHAHVMRAIRDLRQQLNDPTIFGTGLRRLYMYTKEDEMVKWEDVESHIQDAKFRGYQVDSVSFEHGSHCGLIMEDANRYWTTIQRFWQDQDKSDFASTDVEGRIPRSLL